MIKEYLKYKLSLIALYLTAAIIFPLVQYLYGLPMEVVGYSLLIFSFVLMLWLVYGFIRFRRKWHKLKEMSGQITAFSQELPKADNAIEDGYRRIIEALYEMLRDNIAELEKAHIEQVEYYTMWVHQIKTPISAMRLALQNKDRELQSSLLEQELFKIEQYVELALNYTKLKSLASDLVIHEYALEDIVKQSVRKYAPLFIYKKLSVELEDFHTIITTDSKWLSFVLEQLLSNAIKYTNQGGISISFADNTLSVRDTGIGIRSEDMERIFEKGYTGYNGRLDKKASGIGLYLVKKVTDALSIKVSIASEVGQGTTVSLNLLPTFR